MRVLSCADPADRERAVTVAASAVKAGGLVILPTEAAYVLIADAFSPGATGELRRVRGLDRRTPLQVLVRGAGVIDGVASPASAAARDLAAAFWPGGLTLVVPKSPSVRWELGGDERFVQLRCPLHPVALEVIADAGPVATTVARAPDGPVVAVAADAVPLERDVSVFLDYGDLADRAEHRADGGAGPVPRSTIVDCTGDRVAILRSGAVTADELAEVLGYPPDGPA